MGHGDRYAARFGWTVAILVLAGGLCGCSDYKKLSAGGSMPDVFIHDILGQDREPAYYYTLVRDSHKECDFCYRCGDDVYLVDKNVDAVQRLGRASFGRLEGEAEVVVLFTEVALEDCSSLARASAVNSLTQIALKLPAYPGPRVEDRGDRFLALAQELDRLYGWREGTACGGRTPASQQRARSVLQQIGDLKIVDPVVISRSVKFFYGRSYLIDEQDPVVRSAIDTALVKRMRALILHALQGAVADVDETVRRDAVLGLRVLGDRSALETVLPRLPVETSWLVRMEIVGYLGSVGTREGVVALVGLLDDMNASVRHKARAALTRIAGIDYGARPATWKWWARQKDPGMDFGDEEEPEQPDVVLPGSPPPGP